MAGETTGKLRVAVIGGSGFGRFHAQWMAMEGAEIVAYTCSSSESVEATQASMASFTGQSPQGFTDMSEMMEAMHPDAVSICTPYSDHFTPTLMALNAGAHVICEKPMVFDKGKSPETLLAEADEMVQTAQRHGKALAVNLQYAALPEPYFELYRQHRGPLESVLSYHFDMESKGNRHGVHEYEDLWIDLGPHVLTPLLSQIPNATLDPASLKKRVSRAEMTVEMELVNPGGHRVHATARVGSRGKEETPIRRFGFNGFEVDVLSRRDAEGVFQTYLRPVGSEEELQAEDMMRISLRRFLRACRHKETPLVTGSEGRRNLEILMSAFSSAASA